MVGIGRSQIRREWGRGGGVEPSSMRISTSVLPSMFISFIIFLIILPLLHSSSADSPSCTDQLQHCGALVEEFERQLHDLRNGAFRQCFTNTACVHEKIAFDDCYAKSLRAVRAPFGTNAEQAFLGCSLTIPEWYSANSDFLTASEAFRQRSEQCFTVGGGTTDEVLTVFGETGAANATEGDNDGQDVAHLAPVVFGAELADRLWALPSGVTSEQPLLDPEAACGKKESGARVFGGGISRISSSQINNLNMSCTLGSNELDCYRQTLDRDPQHRLLVYSRDKALRSCLNNLHLQQPSLASGHCHFDRSPVQQSCICNAREELDNRMQSAILDCVQQSAVAQLYAALNNVGTAAGEALTPFPAGARYKPTESPSPAVLAQLGDEPISVPSSAAANGATTVLSQGSIVNGQCLCACPRVDQSSLANRPGSAVIAASSNDYYPPAAGKINLSTAGGGGTVVTPAAAGQLPQMVYRPLPAMPWYYQPVQTALSAEAGIASGFERFFNGQPPIRKKREEAEGRNEKEERNDGTE